MLELSDEVSSSKPSSFAELVEMVCELAGQTDTLTTAIGELVEAKRKAPRVWWWPSLEKRAATEAWRLLSGWLYDSLYARHPECRAIPQCWYRHPAIVDELTALYGGWVHAYRTPGASPLAALEWLDRWLPNGMNRMSRALARCQHKHQDDIDGPTEPDNGFQWYVRDDLKSRDPRIVTESA